MPNFPLFFLPSVWYSLICGRGEQRHRAGRRAGDAASGNQFAGRAGAFDHAAALWLVPKRQGAHPKGGGGPNRHLAVVHLTAGKAHHPSAAGGFAGGVLIDFDRYGKKRSAGNRSAPLIFWRNGEK